MSKIIISAAGWCEANPEEVRFQLITDMDDQAYITGTEWLELPEEGNKNQAGRDDYILECVGRAFATAIDGEYDHVDVEVEEEEPKKYKAGDMVYWDDPEGLHSGYYPVTETIGDDRLVLRSGKEVSIGEVW